MKLIAIDPDIDLSGYCIIEDGYIINYGKKSFPQLIEFFQKNKCVVIIEAGYLNKSNWHLHDCKSKQVAAKIGNCTGRNHAIAMKLVEMAKYYDRTTYPVKPLAKMRAYSNSKDGKISHDGLERYLKTKFKRTNQDTRDAILLAWNYKFLEKSK